MRKLALAGVLAAVCLPLPGTTLQQLTLLQMCQKSTSIVRGNLQPSYTAMRGSVLYTHYNILVEEHWKGTTANRIDVAVPGGALQGVRQIYSGAPQLSIGQDYVLFLWTSPTGLTQIIGLSQGLFKVDFGAPGGPTVSRAASQENMVNAAGQQINDSNFTMSLAAFRTAITRALSSGVAP